MTATIVRLASVLRFIEKIKQLDLLSERIDYSYWAVLEMMTAIMCANLPALSAFYRKVTGKDGNTTNGHSSRAATGQANTSKRSFSQWVGSKTASVRQYSANRRTINDSSVVDIADATSQTNLTNYKGGNGDIAVTEFEMVSPTKGASYSTCETVKEEGCSVVPLNHGMPKATTSRSVAHLDNLSSSTSSPVSDADNLESGSADKAQRDNRRVSVLMPNNNNILQTREVTVESSLA